MTDFFTIEFAYLRPREFPFEVPPLPAVEDRPFLPEVLPLRSLLTILFEEELLRPLSPLGVPEVFGCPVDWLSEPVFALPVVSLLPEDLERLLLTGSISISRLAFSFTLPEDRPLDEADGDEPPRVSASSLILITARLVKMSSASYSSLSVCSSCFATCSIPSSRAKVRAVP